MRLPRALLPAALVPSLLGTGTAAAAERPVDGKFFPRGVELDVMPGAAICLPGISVKCAIEGFGSTGPLVGGSFDVGYRTQRHLFVGAGYSGAGLRLAYDPLPPFPGATVNRTYSGFAQAHGVYAVVRATIPIKLLDLSFDVGAGWSILMAPLATGGDLMRSHGFSMRTGASIAYWITTKFYMGVRVDFMINPHLKRCDIGGSVKLCEKRGEHAEREQIPIHLALPGLLFGVVL